MTLYFLTFSVYIIFYFMFKLSLAAMLGSNLANTAYDRGERICAIPLMLYMIYA